MRLGERQSLKRAQTAAQKVVDELNDPIDPRHPVSLQRFEAARKKHLTQFMDEWIRCGCRLEGWQFAHVLATVMNRRDLRLDQHRDGPVYPFYISDVTGLGRPRTAASQTFYEFITGPCYASVQRCARCQRFYLNTSGHRDKKYCSRKCATNDSAAKSTRERRQDEHAQKLTALRTAVAKLTRLSKEERTELKDWKSWLSQRSHLTRHFISRAINMGEIDLPVEL